MEHKIWIILNMLQLEYVCLMQYSVLNLLKDSALLS